MYPVLFSLFGVPVSSYGVTLIVGFLVGNWITTVRWRELGRDPAVATTLCIYVMVGGIAGAKLYFAFDTWLRGAASFWDSLRASEGLTWYGGMIGSVLAVTVGCRMHGVPLRFYAETACFGGAVGEAIGRLGCFLVGDDYGPPTDVPWAVAFPHGNPPTLVPVHPTPLYHVAWLLPVAALLWRRRGSSPWLFGEYLVLTGAGRIVVEQWRVNPRVAFGLTEPQWIGMALVAIGTVGWLAGRPSRRPAASAP